MDTLQSTFHSTVLQVQAKIKPEPHPEVVEPEPEAERILTGMASSSTTLPLAPTAPTPTVIISTPTTEPTKTHHEISQRAVAVALKAMGVKTSVITEWTGMPTRTVQALVKKARERGYDPNVSKVYDES